MSRDTSTYRSARRAAYREGRKTRKDLPWSIFRLSGGDHKSVFKEPSRRPALRVYDDAFHLHLLTSVAP